ncbi:hypothetical protein DPMN_177123 [Dreissena polymorpha]|uniref:Uncharacterized protein n=1 Tax=Dreissena polymorpha TaxID=45954 RepID=A0A9D4E9S5_DREPO|nr:hypothetical protein DPMN_177123 [Dreissena polymorpha]
MLGSASDENNSSILRGPYSTVYPYSSGQYRAQDWTRERIHSQGREYMSYNHIMVRYSGDRTPLCTRTLQASTGHKTGQGREYIQSRERIHVIQPYNGEILLAPSSTVHPGMDKGDNTYSHIMVGY